jgi:transcriptional regulator with XRE-family HTH domain
VQPINEWLVQPGGLAQQLRELRRAAGLEQADIAEVIGTSQAGVSRIESGRRLPNASEVRLWAERTDASAADRLVRLVEDGEVVNRRWKTALKEGAKVQVMYDQLVRGGDRIRSCQVLVLPGLLQTRDYARAQKLAAWRPLGIDATGVEDTIDAAMRRQEALYDRTKTFEFYFTAAALDYWPCPASVMAGQYDRLLTASHMPNVTIGIVPPRTQLAAIPLLGFLIVDDLAVVEMPHAEDVRRGDDVSFYRRVADDTAAEAVTGDAARALITAAAAQLPR